MKRMHVYIKEDTINALDVLLIDPYTGKPSYGAKTLIFEYLIENFLTAHKTGKKALDLKPLYAQIHSSLL